MFPYAAFVPNCSKIWSLHKETFFREQTSMWSLSSIEYFEGGR